MSLDAMDWVWEYSQAKGVARLVMLTIADKAPNRECTAFASLTLLQHRANAGRSTVVGAIRDQVNAGELEVVEGESGPYGAAMYRLPKALGHVRRARAPRTESVQKPNRSNATPDGQTGAESAPISELETSPIGAESAPNEPVGLGSISAETEPIAGVVQLQIGADSGRESVQILDPIGADSAPVNHEPLQNQEEVLRTSSPSRKRSASKADAKPPTAKRESTAKRGTRIPEDFAITDAMRQWGGKRAPHVDGELETEKFINHFMAAPGQRGVKVDWVRTWQNWILNAIKDYPPNGDRRRAPASGPTFGAPSLPPAPWCGHCNRITREVENHRDQLVPCPTCSPKRRNP